MDYPKSYANRRRGIFHNNHNSFIALPSNYLFYLLKIIIFLNTNE